jgi:type 1 fimbria pilin
MMIKPTPPLRQRFFPGAALIPVLAAALAYSSQAQAQTADCTLALSTPTIDFGTLNRATLNQAVRGAVSMGQRSLSIQINCDQPTDMTLFFRAAATGNKRFQLGSLGSYTLHLRDALLDGSTVELGEVPAPGQTPSRIDTALSWRPDQGMAPMRAGVAVPGRSFLAQLDIAAWTKEDALHAREDIVWQAPGAIEMLPIGISSEINVQASITPIACTPTLSGNGVVDFGVIPAHTLNRSTNTQLTPKFVTLTLNCDGPASFALSILEGRPDSATAKGATDFGLSKDRRGNNIGRYRVAFDEPSSKVRADTATRLFLTESSNSRKEGWSKAHAGTTAMAQGVLYGFTDTQGSTAGPKRYQSLTATLSVAPVIAPLDSLDLSEVIKLDGFATIEVNYL